MFGAGETAGADFAGIIGNRRFRLHAQLTEAFDEFGFELGEEAQHVIDDQDLTIAAHARADAHRRDRQRIGDVAGQPLY